MTHAALYGQIAAGEPWVRQELSRIRSHHRVGEEGAKDILHEVSGYYVQDLMQGWGRAAIRLQRGDSFKEAQSLMTSEFEGTRMQGVSARVRGRDIEHDLSAEARQAIGRLWPSLATPTMQRPIRM
ncbi:MAG: hypothetical protein EOO74_05990 [Myxococcales bacterium]|nr:MAG: hypothetical protein EOO74_05990 [Myxococcales bacterium]